MNDSVKERSLIMSDGAVASQRKWAARTDYMTVPMSEIVPGDEIANSATVTKVVHGPAEATDDGWGTPVADGCVRVEMGESSSITADARSLKVVGRRRPLKLDTSPASLAP